MCLACMCYFSSCWFSWILFPFPFLLLGFRLVRGSEIKNCQAKVEGQKWHLQGAVTARLTTRCDVWLGDVLHSLAAVAPGF